MARPSCLSFVADSILQQVHASTKQVAPHCNKLDPQISSRAQSRWDALLQPPTVHLPLLTTDSALMKLLASFSLTHSKLLVFSPVQGFSLLLPPLGRRRALRRRGSLGGHCHGRFIIITIGVLVVIRSRFRLRLKLLQGFLFQQQTVTTTRK